MLLKTLVRHLRQKVFRVTLKLLMISRTVMLPDNNFFVISLIDFTVAILDMLNFEFGLTLSCRICRGAVDTVTANPFNPGPLEFDLDTVQLYQRIVSFISSLILIDSCNRCGSLCNFNVRVPREIYFLVASHDITVCTPGQGACVQKSLLFA